MTTKLSLANLGSLPATVAVPAYGRSDLKAGIFHFGVGNFHRAHQAVYLDDLFGRGQDHDWAILGGGVFAGERAGRERLAAQDWLSTVVEQDAAGRTARVTGAMTGYVEPGDRAATIAALSDPAIRIVSLTITEGGYFIDAASGHFNPNHPEIVSDSRDPENARTVFGLMLAALSRRRAAGTAPFTVMCCDNIPHNGHVTAEALVGLARLSDPSFAQWIEDNVAFPNGMVDRITPATTDRERNILAEDFGVEDSWPVFCEPFRQWVLEDRFPTGRPRLEDVGVQFVPDVSPFELMKIRILNGGHAVIAYPGGLMGIHFVHEAMQEPLIAGFLDKVEREEIIPTVPPVPDTDLDAYFALIVDRFSNPAIGDTVRRLCLDGSNRQPKFIVPTIADRLAAGRPVDGLALESALWCRYCAGTNDAGETIEPNDPNWDRLLPIAQASRQDPGRWLAMDDIYGDVGRSDVFAAAFADALDRLWSHGARRTLETYLGAGS